MTSHRRRRKSETMPYFRKEGKKDANQGKEKIDGNGKPMLPLPLLQKSVYIDLKAGKTASVLEEQLRKLGAVVEKFLSREVNYVISSSAPLTKIEERQSNEDNPQSPSFANVPSPFSSIPSPTAPSDSKASLVSRGKALAQIAYARNRASTVVANAEKWGIKVVSLEAATKWLDREIKKIEKENGKDNIAKLNDEKSKKKVVNKKKKVLKGTYIKFEAVNRMYRPVKTELEKWPRLNLLAPPGLNSFCEVKMKLQDLRRRQSSLRLGKTSVSASSGKAGLKKSFSLSSMKESVSAVTTLQGAADVVAVPITTTGDVKRHLEMPQRKRPDKLQGYCESCRMKYKDMNKHVKEEEHQTFARDKTNYESLDALILQVPSTIQFLQDILLQHCAQKQSDAVPPNERLLSKKVPEPDYAVRTVISTLPSEVTPPPTADRIKPFVRSPSMSQPAACCVDNQKEDPSRSDSRPHAVVIRRPFPSGVFVSPRRREPTPSKKPWMQERSMVFRDSPMASLQPSDVCSNIKFVVSERLLANPFMHVSKEMPNDGPSGDSCKKKSVVRSLLHTQDFEPSSVSVDEEELSEIDNGKGVVLSKSDDKVVEKKERENHDGIVLDTKSQVSGKSIDHIDILSVSDKEDENCFRQNIEKSGDGQNYIKVSPISKNKDGLDCDKSKCKTPEPCFEKCQKIISRKNGYLKCSDIDRKSNSEGCKDIEENEELKDSEKGLTVCLEEKPAQSDVEQIRIDVEMPKTKVEEESKRKDKNHHSVLNTRLRDCFVPCIADRVKRRSRVSDLCPQGKEEDHQHESSGTSACSSRTSPLSKQSSSKTAATLSSSVLTASKSKTSKFSIEVEGKNVNINENILHSNSLMEMDINEETIDYSADFVHTKLFDLDKSHGSLDTNQQLDSKGMDGPNFEVGANSQQDETPFKPSGNGTEVVNKRRKGASRKESNNSGNFCYGRSQKEGVSEDVGTDNSFSESVKARVTDSENKPHQVSRDSLLVICQPDSNSKIGNTAIGSAEPSKKECRDASDGAGLKCGLQSSGHRKKRNKNQRKSFTAFDEKIEFRKIHPGEEVGFGAAGESGNGTGKSDDTDTPLKGDSPLNIADGMKSRIRQCRLFVHEGLCANGGRGTGVNFDILKNSRCSSTELDKTCTVQDGKVERCPDLSSESTMEERNENLERLNKQKESDLKSESESQWSGMKQVKRRTFNGKRFHSTKADWDVKDDKENVNNHLEVEEPATPNMCERVKQCRSCTQFNHEGQYANDGEGMISKSDENVEEIPFRTQDPQVEEPEKLIPAVVVRRVAFARPSMEKRDVSWCKVMSKKDWSLSEAECEDKSSNSKNQTEEELRNKSIDQCHQQEGESNLLCSRKIATDLESSISHSIAKVTVMHRSACEKRLSTSKRENAMSARQGWRKSDDAKETGSGSQNKMNRKNDATKDLERCKQTEDVREKASETNCRVWTNSPRLRMKFTRSQVSDCYSSTLEIEECSGVDLSTTSKTVDLETHAKDVELFSSPRRFTKTSGSPVFQYNVENSDSIDLLDTPRRGKRRSQDQTPKGTPVRPVRNFAISPLKSGEESNCSEGINVESTDWKSAKRPINHVPSRKKRKLSECEKIDHQVLLEKGGSSLPTHSSSQTTSDNTNSQNESQKIHAKRRKLLSEEGIGNILKPHQNDTKCDTNNSKNKVAALHAKQKCLRKILYPSRRKCTKFSKSPLFCHKSKKNIKMSKSECSNKAYPKEAAGVGEDEMTHQEETKHKQITTRKNSTLRAKSGGEKNKRKLCLSDEAACRSSKKIRLNKPSIQDSSVFNSPLPAGASSGAGCAQEIDVTRTDNAFVLSKDSVVAESCNVPDSNKKLHSEVSGNNIGDLLNFIPEFSSPGKTNSSWDDAFDSYFNSSVRDSYQTPGRRGSVNTPKFGSLWSPAKHNSPRKANNHTHSNSSSAMVVKSPSRRSESWQSRGSPNCHKYSSNKNIRSDCHVQDAQQYSTPTKTKRSGLIQSSHEACLSVEKIDSVVSFNHMSPQRLHFSPVKLKTPLRNSDQTPSVQKVDSVISFNHMSPQRLQFSPVKMDAYQDKHGKGNSSGKRRL